MFPEGLKYTKNHSWVKVEGGKGELVSPTMPRNN